MNFVIPVHLTYSSRLHPRAVFAGSRAACVAPALKMGRSRQYVHTASSQLACVTPQVTGLRRRAVGKGPWLFHLHLRWPLRMGVEVRVSGGSESGQCTCVCLCAWFAGNLRGLQVTPGWDLCADGPRCSRWRWLCWVRGQMRDRGRRTLGTTSGWAGSGTSCYLCLPAHGTALPQDDVSWSCPPHQGTLPCTLTESAGVGVG